MKKEPWVAILLFLSILIFVHELGHFLVGKFFGIGVEMFSIGFGPRILSYTHRDTQYRLALLPLGGFVKFAGALPGEEVPEAFVGKEMHRASSFARFCTVLAGPMANFLLAVGVFTWIAANGMMSLSPVIGEILPGGPGERAGLRPGDRVVSIDGTSVDTWDDFRTLVAESPGKTLNLEVENPSRTPQRAPILLTPELTQEKDFLGRAQARAGIAPGFTPPIVTVTGKPTPGFFETGDRVLKVEEHTISYWYEFKDLLSHGPLKVTVERGGKHLDILIPSGASPETLGLAPSLLTFAKTKELLVAFEGKPVPHLFELAKLLEANQNPTPKISVIRKGELVSGIPLALSPQEIQTPEGKKTYYQLKEEFLAQLTPPLSQKKTYSLPQALVYGMKETLGTASLIFSTTWGLIQGTVPTQVLGGPIMIAKVAQESMVQGMQTFLLSMAHVSVNLGVMNLLPIPILDGGQIILILWQAIRRRPLDEMMIENFQKVGFVLLLALVVLATYNDLSRFWASMIESFLG
jgi:regulator of sigma E protease